MQKLDIVTITKKIHNISTTQIPIRTQASPEVGSKLFIINYRNKILATTIIFPYYSCPQGRRFMVTKSLVSTQHICCIQIFNLPQSQTSLKFRSTNVVPRNKMNLCTISCVSPNETTTLLVNTSHTNLRIRVVCITLEGKDCKTDFARITLPAKDKVFAFQALNLR